MGFPLRTLFLTFSIKYLTKIVLLHTQRKKKYIFKDQNKSVEITSTQEFGMFMFKKI